MVASIRLEDGGASMIMISSIDHFTIYNCIQNSVRSIICLSDLVTSDTINCNELL